MSSDYHHEKTLGTSTLFCVLGVMLAALATFGLTFSSYFYPGESASLFAQWMGMDALALPSHPFWASIVRLFAGETYSAQTINVLSLVCGVLSAGMLSTLVAFFVRNCVTGEDTIRHRETASNVAAVFAGFVFITSTAVWQGSTHLEYRMFETFFALLVFMPILLLHRLPNAVLPVATIVGAAAGVGIVEDAIFLPLISVYGFVLSVMAMRCGKKFYFPVGLFLLSLGVSYVVYSSSVAKAYLLLPEAEAGNMKSVGDVVSRMMLSQFAEMKLWFSRFDPMLGRRCPCFIVILLSVTPFLLCGFAAKKSLNHNRTWSDYIFHAGMTVCVILATATGISPESLLRPFGIAPIATSTLVAATAGYIAAYWYLVSFTKSQSQGVKQVSEDMILRTKLGKMIGGVFATILVFNALVNSFRCTGDPGAFADICAGEAIDKLEDRSWVVTDGLLDDHLRVVAASRKKNLNLVCLQRDMDEAYLKELAALVRGKKLSSAAADLSLSVQLGVLPFLQDWFSGDTNVLKNVVIFGVPDLWSMADCTPMPENIFFGGVRQFDEAKAIKTRDDFIAYWNRVSPYLKGDEIIGSRSIFKSGDAIERLRLQLRRHAGFVANNIGVVLQDAKKDKEAFEMYEMVRKTIDPDNVCALFNEFEMARAGVKEALARKNEINKELKAIVDDPKRRYQLYSLSRYYGYIRSPEIFARMGFAWARSGQTGSAIAQVRRAINFVPEDRQAGLLNMMAAIYANNNDSQKSREVYERVLKQDENNHDALMGLSRLAMQKGSLDDAKKFLSKAIKVAANKETSSFDNALLNLLSGDLDSARMSLQKVTDLQPKSLQAWSLLSGVLLQQIDQAKDEATKKRAFEELEGVILPKMEAIASSPRDYYVQMTRALVYMRKNTDDYRKRARTALVSAYRERPEVTVIGDMILNLDISLNDSENALKHARMILRRNRQDKLANYVMGSIRLREGDYVSAETFLRISCQAENPIAAAQNDFAEVLRRLQRYSEAEISARAAVKTAPKLYVAWETLGSILLDQKKNLDEAEKCVQKAIDLTKEDGAKINDIRMQITLARVQIAKGDRARARGTLRSIMSHQKELSKYEYGEFERLLKLANEKK